MNYVACCPDLEHLIAKPDWKNRLGLMIVINKRGPQFFLQYQKDWSVPVAADGIQIAFCPYCGSQLRG
jgi:hypothetical protein